MKLTTAFALVLVAVAPLFGSAQDLKDRLKIHKERLPRPSHRLYNVHGRRFAVKQGDGKHQPRLQSRKDRHYTRKTVRKVTHQLTAPHKHTGPHKP